MTLTDADRDWLLATLEGDTPVFEGCVRSDRVRRLTSYGLIERRWSPRDGWLLAADAAGAGRDRRDSSLRGCLDVPAPSPDGQPQKQDPVAAERAFAKAWREGQR